MNCSKCGDKINSGDSFCANCGSALVSKVPLERIEEILKSLKSNGSFHSVYLTRISLEEKDALIKTITERENAELAIDILYFLQDDNKLLIDSRITPEEKGQLKQLILKTKSEDIACLALLNISRQLTKDERLALLKTAVTTQNPYFAYRIYQNNCHELAYKKEERASLRKVVVWTKDPAMAFYFLQRQDDDTIPYEDDLKSLEYTNDELKRFKEVIISSRNPEWAYKLLTTKETKEKMDARAAEDADFWDDEPYAVVELTPNERVTLKRLIIESQNAWWTYEAFLNVSDLSEGERMVLKGITVKTEEPNLACYILCNTDFISHLDTTERSHLKQLAIQVKDKYNAEKLLAYVYDLTSEEKENLKKVL